jgi:hypothetical protein
MRRFNHLFIFWFALLCVVLIPVTVVFAGSDSEHPESKSIITGVAVTPKNFPSHTVKDIDDAFQTAAEIGSHAVFIYQWGRLDFKIARMMMAKAKAEGLVPILGLSPTTLDQERKELDLPPEVRRRAGSNISFANPIIRNAFLKTAKDLAIMKPRYLCLATEINFLVLQRLTEYLHFASLYKEAYQAVKKVSPQTDVFVTFQWELMRIVDAKKPEDLKEHSNVIDIFRPELDLIGLTTYPAAFHPSPGKLPNDYYSWIYHHIAKEEKILLMEVGWPTSGVGTVGEQAAFIGRLPSLLEDMNIIGLEWALLHDVNLAEFDANLNTVGLITDTGKKKPGFSIFKALKKVLNIHLEVKK